jgi:hypothetical protein
MEICTLKFHKCAKPETEKYEIVIRTDMEDIRLRKRHASLRFAYPKSREKDWKLDKQRTISGQCVLRDEKRPRKEV